MLLVDDDDEEEEEEDVGVGELENSLDRSGAGGIKSSNRHRRHHHPPTTDGVQRDGHHPIKTVSLHSLYELAINHVANGTTHHSSDSPIQPTHPTGAPVLDTEVRVGLGQLKLRYQRLLHGVRAFRSFDMDEEEAVALQARASWQASYLARCSSYTTSLMIL